MLARCYNPNSKAFKDYGGRGITVCDEWKNDSVTFFEWTLLNGYSEDLTIERIDNNGDYTPENCGWATQKEQMNNKRSSQFITYKNETKNITQWSKDLGVNKGTLFYRFHCGWSDEEIIETPIKGRKNKK